MQNTNKICLGFTLIELLVVVLIIGILAAIALPQYQKAVEKSKTAQAIALLRSVYQAANSYYLANGIWPTTFEQLDVDIPWTGNESITGKTTSKSNESWSIELVRSTNEDESVRILRLTGQYRSNGFVIYRKHLVETVPLGEILCMEYGDYYSANAGYYCKNVLRYTKRIVSHGAVQYNLFKE